MLTKRAAVLSSGIVQEYGHAAMSVYRPYDLDVHAIAGDRVRPLHHALDTVGLARNDGRAWKGPQHVVMCDTLNYILARRTKHREEFLGELKLFFIGHWGASLR
jgi:hypothetical protein